MRALWILSCAAFGFSQIGAATSDGGIPSESFRKGVVSIEREGGVWGVGTVLAGDGRVLTSLTALRGADAFDLRYADGSTAKARIGHQDARWDLALLVPADSLPPPAASASSVPQPARARDGLRAGEGEPASVQIVVPARAGKAPSVKMKGKGLFRSKTGDELVDAWDLEFKGMSVAAGAPLVDPSGQVFGVLVHACRPGPAHCAPTWIGAPVTEIRRFLSRTPTATERPAPWLGIIARADRSGTTAGVRIVRIAPKSPAEKSGLKTDPDPKNADLITAADALPVETPEQLGEILGRHAPGDAIKLLVFGPNGRLREVQAVLASAPEP